MRFLICLAAIVLLSLPVFCQDGPIQFSVLTKKVSDKQYQLLVKAKIENKWYVYADADQVNGLDQISIGTENENITLLSVAIDYGGSTLIKDKIFANNNFRVFKDSFKLSQLVNIKGIAPPSIKLNIQAFAANGEEFLPIQETTEVILDGAVSYKEISIQLSNVRLNAPVTNCGHKLSEEDNSLWSIFVNGFIGGLIALLMPCIFPMLPVTVSFFMNKAGSKIQGIRNGILYGVFIFIIYLLASLPFHIAGNVNPQIFNIISTNPWINITFFTVFIVFALSLFGLFELRLPGAIANSANMKGNAGSMGGIFFMALTLAIVSFSCTGPILGFLLVNSINAANGAWALTAGMAGFGIALALPFGLFAMFPQWMKKLPKSGGWMETLKKSLAFIELALAVKFLSNADLVEHWGILKREVFIGLWILIALGLAFYLFGAFDKKKYSRYAIGGYVPAAKKPRGRIAFGALVLLFAFYLVPGITNHGYANLKLLSGFPPPLSYSVYGKDNVHGKGIEPDVINDYDKALAMAKQTGKPLLIDFTGWACVNCRKMEENVWTIPEVAELIKKNFILVSLYVDDKEKLPADKRFSYTNKTGHEKYVKTIGDKWASFQAENFGSASQPQYVILSPGEELLNHPVGYTPAIKYKAWLECGLAATRK